MEPISDLEWNEDMKELFGDNVFDGGSVLAIEDSARSSKRLEHTPTKEERTRARKKLKGEGKGLLEMSEGESPNLSDIMVVLSVIERN